MASGDELDLALRLFGLTNFEILEEHTLQTKARHPSPPHSLPTAPTCQPQLTPCCLPGPAGLEQHLHRAGLPRDRARHQCLERHQGKLLCGYCSEQYLPPGFFLALHKAHCFSALRSTKFISKRSRYAPQQGLPFTA